MKKSNYSAFQKLLSAVLTLVLIVGLLPRITLPAAADTGSGVLNVTEKLADSGTIDSWMQYFGPDKLSTEFAGGVWTDKSVFTNSTAFPGVSMDSADNFLVAMSAIASNKEVEGQAFVPTDTMLVLDLSNSMDSIAAIPDMVKAANAAIHKLLNMNKASRVGVVLYSGNSQVGNASTGTAVVILPLGRYQAVSGNQYLAYTGSSKDTTVTRASGLKYEDGSTIYGTSSKTTSGATYIQNGLYKAWKEFEDVTDTTVTSGAMAGTKRTPVYILMSDGEPTVATTSYNNVGTSTVGDGQSPKNQNTRNQLSFLTQLTASWVKGKAEEKYGTDALFYTLGLGISANESATAVLSPSSTNNTVSGWWDNFLDGTAGSNVTVNSNGWRLYRDGAVKEFNYVDGFWSADQASQLPEMFEQITSQIAIASEYSVTLVQSGDYDMDGYITFEDEIGELMEVKDVKGILLGSTLFSGAELAKRMNEDYTGGISNPSDYGNELVRTVKERIGITNTSTAQQLINSAYQAGQLSYIDNDNYSNYIGWYADGAGNYLSFWQESDGITMENAPAGAVYINKSYGYLGAAGDSNMMHVVVQLSTKITTGHQIVKFKIPAALIPTVTYRVEADGDTLEEASKLTRTGAEPIRLLFEVGLRSDINAINLVEKVSEYLAADPAHHIHQNADGTYTFFTNQWGKGDGDQNPTFNQALTDYVAESHFYPSYQNERYYYTDDTPIYVASGNGYIQYTGTAQPSGTGYYHRRTVITASTNGGEAGISYKYVPISAITLSDTNNVKQIGGSWYVAAGVTYMETTRFDTPKGANTTETLMYSNYPMVVHDASGYNVYAILGNNGRLTLAPAQGIKLSKTVSEASTQGGAPTSFDFTVTLDGEIASAIQLSDADGNAFTGTSAVGTEGGKTIVTVTLADKQVVYITGIPTGTAYTVSEAQSIYYNSNHTDDQVSGTVTASRMDDVEFVNAPRKPGTLAITKEVFHPFPGRPAVLDTISFTVEVDLGIQAAGAEFSLSDGTPIVADERGVLTISIKAEQTVVIDGILEDTPYLIREVNIPSGFVWDEAASTGLHGAVNGQANLVNRYVPTPPVTNPDVEILVNKAVSGTYTEDETFTFLVEKLNPETNQYEILATKTIQIGWPGTASGSVSITDLVKEFTTLGSHTFRITEQDGSTVGMTYSNQRSVFQVNVIDPEMDGQMEIEVVNQSNTTVAKTGEAYTVSANFTNIYSVGSTHVDVNVQKTLTNSTGVDIPMTSFQFGLYTDPECTVPANIVEGQHLTVYTGPTGLATIRIPVTNVSQDGAVYYVKEIVPGAPEAGMTYSDAVYQVKLTVVAVEEAGVATLTATPEITLYSGTGSVTGSTVAFQNQYVLQSTSAILGGSKSYIRGYDNSSIALSGGEFTFQLWSIDSNYDADTLLDTATNHADGSFSFDALSYSKVGTYDYIIREAAGDKSYITYDPITYYAMVVVTKGEGDTLQREIKYRKAGDSVDSTQVQFANTYNVGGTDTTVISGNKQLTVTQGSKQLAGGDFSFGLYENGVLIDSTVNHANGDFAFKTITYTAEQVGEVHTYTVQEIVPAGAVQNPNGTYTYNGVTYSAASYQVQVTVQDNGDGTISAVQTVSGNAPIAFTNTYYAAPASYTVSGMKYLSGRSLNGEEFTFELYETSEDYRISGTPICTAENAAGGSFTMAAISYTEVGIHYYVLRENIPAVDDENRLGGVSYDASVYQIRVQVVDNGTGKLTTLVNVSHPGYQNTDLSFRNSYTAQPAILELAAQKDYNKDLEEGQFTFYLEGTIGETPVSQEKTNDGDGKVTFDTLVFENTGIYTFTVTEKEDLQHFPWIDFDPKEYTVEVDVKDPGNGQLTADVTYYLGEKPNHQTTNEIVFTNTYGIIHGAEFTLSGAKTYLGADLKAGQFQFGLYSDPNCTQMIGTAVSNTRDTSSAGKFTFPKITIENLHLNDLPAVRTYYIREIMPADVQAVPNGNGGVDYIYQGVFYDPAVFTVTVNLTDNGVGGVNSQILVNGAPDGQVAFTNSYSIINGNSLAIEGKKNVTNMDMEQFAFGLYDAAGELMQKAYNSSTDGTFQFAPLAYTPAQAGQTFTYTVKEIEPDEAVNHVYQGVTYDDTVYTMTVEVKDDGQGGIELVKKINGAASTPIVFNNRYDVIGQATAVIDGKKIYKHMNGGVLDVAEGAFNFNLYKDGEIISSAETQADGTFAFPELTFTPNQVGETFTYEVREASDGKDYITYSSVVFTVKIQVKDNGVGGIELVKTVNDSATASIEFNNTYKIVRDGKVEVTGTKYYANAAGGEKDIPADLFSFKLSGEGYEETVKNQAGGSFAFTALTYDAADIGQIYEYIIEEVKGDKDYITYDETTKYTLKVVIEDDGQGGLKITKTINGAENTPVVFTNTYNIITGDSLTIDGKKNVTNMEQKAFTFGLFAEDGTKLDTAASSTTDGTFSFDKLTYTPAQAGQTFTYTVKEIEPNEAVDHVYQGVTYDDTVYTVTVEVKDNGTGGITLIKKVNGTAGTPIVFNNRYDVTGQATEVIGGKKLYNHVNGGALDVAVDAFSFDLYKDGQIIDTAKTQADGTFAFETLTFTPDMVGDTFTYEVREADGGKDYITYSGAVFTVKIQVKDNGVGGIELAKTVNGSTTTPIEFTNTYKIVRPGKVEISGNKNFVDAAGAAREIPADLFSFKLSGEGYEETVKNQSGGSFAFTALTYDAADIGQTYEYTIEEVKGDKAYITYDETTKYTLKVTVEDDGQGGLVITKTINGAEDTPVVFSNTYNIISGDTVEINGIKNYLETEMLGGEFTFALYQTDADYSIAGKEPIATTTNAADGSFSFKPETVDAFNYTAVGTHHYVLVEDATDPMADVLYDSSTYHFKVEVTDNNDGTLTAAILCENGDQSNITFRNVPYEEITQKEVALVSDPAVSVDGKKVNVGEKMVYTIRYTNYLGKTASVTITDKIPANTTYVAQSAGTGEYNAQTGTITWLLQVPAEETVEVSFQVTVDKPDVIITNKATVVDGKNSYTTNEVVSHTFEEESEKDVFDTQKPNVSVDGKEVQVGQTLLYTIRYTNLTGKNASVTIADKIPANTTFVSADKGGKNENGTVTWMMDVAAWESVTVTMKVKVNAADVTIKNKATVSVGEHSVTTNEVTTDTYEKVSPPLGDNFQMVLLSVLLLVSGTGIIALAVTRKKKEEQ